jgi:hypothetical protein
MMNEENSHPVPRNQDFSLMLETHIDDMLKVNFVNFAAFAVSMSDFSEWVRVLLLTASLVYTICKIAQTVQEMRKKK